MSLLKEFQSSSTHFHDLDGSDGPAYQSKSQAQYAEEVKAHLEAARAALSQMTVSSLGALCSDPTLDPVYVGCMRELAGLGCGHDGKEGLSPKSIPTETLEKQQMTVPASLAKSVKTSQSSIPGYTFTAYFFPPETYSQCAREDRPTEATLTRAMTAAMKKNASTAHITEPITVSWTPNGDIIIRVPPDAIGLESFLQQISIITVVKKASPSSSIISLPLWNRVRVHGDPPIHLLRLHRVRETWFPNGDFSLIRALFPVVASDSDESTQVDYALPHGFLIACRSVILKDGKGSKEDTAIYDVFIDLTGLKEPFISNVRRVCRNCINLKSMYRRTMYTFSTSFIELHD